MQIDIYELSNGGYAYRITDAERNVHIVQEHAPARPGWEPMTEAEAQAHAQAVVEAMQEPPDEEYEG